MLEAETKYAELERQISDIMAKIDEMSKVISSVFDIVSEIQSKNAYSNFNTEGSTPIEANPWARQAGNDLRRALNADVNSLAQMFSNPNVLERPLSLKAIEPYLPTLRELIKSDEGITAEQISEVTGRSRNTESSYLFKLFLAGVVDRSKDGKIARYSPKDRNRLKNISGLNSN
jgi:predicted transcriptional regulator